MENKTYEIQALTKAFITSSSSIVLLAGGGKKFDVEAASAAATITDTVLGRNSSDTLLEDGSGVISGEITGVEASEEPDEGIIGNSSSGKIFREKRDLEMRVMIH